MAVFEFISCTNEQVTLVEFSGSPSVGTIYRATGVTGSEICGIVGSSSVERPRYTAVTEYDSCVECLEFIIPVISANTEYDVCVNCSGNTFTIEVEHPVWSGLYGESVIQLNAVQLGGRNGLNS
jgi:hypothetical protein